MDIYAKCLTCGCEQMDSAADMHTMLHSLQFLKENQFLYSPKLSTLQFWFGVAKIWFSSEGEPAMYFQIWSFLSIF